MLNNTSTVKEILSVLGLQVSDAIPSPVAVVNTNPKDYRVSKVLGAVNPTSTGANTIITASSSKDTYLSSIALSAIKDVTCDIATGQIAVTCVINGVTVTICGIAVLTTTAQNASLFFEFNKPIKVDRSSVVSLTGTHTVGAMSRSCSIHGFEVEDSEK